MIFIPAFGKAESTLLVFFRRVFITGTWFSVRTTLLRTTHSHTLNHVNHHALAVYHRVFFCALLCFWHQTAAEWGVAVTPEAITEAKVKGDANNDWVRGCGGSKRVVAVLCRAMRCSVMHAYSNINR